MHLAAVAWSVGLVALGLECPLTPLENELRQVAGVAPLRGGFIDHYVEGALYPPRWTPLVQVGIAVTVVGSYVLLWLQRRRRLSREP